MTTLMRREIGEIPSVVERLVHDSGAAEQVAEAIRRAHPRYLTIVARGTSDHAGVYARYLFEALAGLPSGLAAPSITTVYGAHIDWRDVLLLSLSQSGMGPDVTEVTETARRGGALTVAITNAIDSPLASAAEHVLPCEAGREMSVAATKTYVAELTIIAALAARVAGSREMLERLQALPDVLSATIASSEAWLVAHDGPVDAHVTADRTLVVSRGFNLSTALEVALKLKETARIFADGYSSADLLHGPIVLAGPDVPVLCLRPDGPVGAAIDAGIDVVRRAGAEPWIVGGAEVAGRARALAIAETVPEPLTPIAYVVPGQLLAESVARRRGLDPDAPAGLSKVTRTH